MAKQKPSLGRGLGVLITGASEVLAAQQAISPTDAFEEEGIPQVPIDSITPNPHQPRKVALREDDPQLLALSVSIKEHGLLQPIVVTRISRSKAYDATSWFSDEPVAEPAVAEAAIEYCIIAGERRWRASRLAGLSTVPVMIKDATPQQMLALALIENLQRADLNPIEEALAYQALIEEFGLTQEMVARQVGKDRSTITNALRLLQLSPKVREELINQPEVFSEGHARALVGIMREEDQVAAMHKVITLRLNVRQTEELAARIKASASKVSESAEAAAQQPATSLPRRPALLEELETSFRNALMVKVDLKCNTKGKGTLVLHFNDQAELEGLYSRLVKPEE
ncbi:MAG: ParB/RepB/Spo0J family partition protein [Chloroflexi bacterium]|nr:MAG: ParB/RepB/Spo0J family partition protein [Chloroflexota bacterium]